MLASRFKGPLASNADGRELLPSDPVFHVLVQLDRPAVGLREIRGQLQLQGERRSLLAQGATSLFAVLLRESDF